MGLFSIVVAQIHKVVSLPALPHMRSKLQFESHAGLTHTPLMQSLPKMQELSHLPQCALSFFVSWQVPLQSSTPRPPQMGGLGVGDVDEVEDVVESVVLDS
jgi:hypothetical protein